MVFQNCLLFVIPEKIEQTAWGRFEKKDLQCVAKQTKIFTNFETLCIFQKFQEFFAVIV